MADLDQALEFRGLRRRDLAGHVPKGRDPHRPLEHGEKLEWVERLGHVRRRAGGSCPSSSLCRAADHDERHRLRAWTFAPTAADEHDVALWMSYVYHDRL